MKLTVSYKELEGLVRKMGAERSSWVAGDAQLSPREKLLEDLERGIGIDLSEVISGPGSLLTYAGEQVILYIKDTRDAKDKLQYSPEQSRRFHVAECTTLSDMREKGRFERYVVTRRTDGFFTVDWLERETNKRGEIDAALKVCKNCLKEINYNRYETRNSDKNSIWKSFSIPSFLRDYSTFFVRLPSRTDENAPIDDYVKGWSGISTSVRQARSWACEKCSVNLEHVKNLLHVHHKNGVKTDNSDRNLKVLCALCHAEEPMHNHLKVRGDEKQRILSARVAKSLSG